MNGPKRPHTMLALVFGLLLGTQATATKYVVKTTYDRFQPSTYRVSLNGRAVTLLNNVNGSVDLTSMVKKGKNTLTVETTPGKNTSSYSKNVLTLGAGENGKWRTLYTVEVVKGSGAGRTTHTFMATPDPSQKPGQVSVSAEIDRAQPAEFKVTLNGEVITTLKGDGNTDLTPLLKPGKNLLTVNFKRGRSTSGYAQSVLTVGQQYGSQWSPLVKWSLGATDPASGSFTFPIYR